MAEPTDPTFASSEAVRQQGLAVCRDQLAAWGIAPPAVEPVVRDFGLREFDTYGEVEFWIANRPGEGYCGKLLFLRDGQTCPGHRHRTKHETFYILKGRVRMVVEDHERVLEEGAILPMPARTRHRFTALEPALVLEISMPSVLGDNYFDDPRIGRGGAYDHPLLADPETGP